MRELTYFQIYQEVRRGHEPEGYNILYTNKGTPTKPVIRSINPDNIKFIRNDFIKPHEIHLATAVVVPEIPIINNGFGVVPLGKTVLIHTVYELTELQFIYYDYEDYRYHSQLTEKLNHLYDPHKAIRKLDATFDIELVDDNCNLMNVINAGVTEMKGPELTDDTNSDRKIILNFAWDWFTEIVNN